MDSIPSLRLPPPRRPRGSALLVALVFLVILTLVGLAAARMSTADETIARNSRDQTVALQAAEAALRDARVDIFATRAFTGATGATATCDYVANGNYKGFCLPAVSPAANVWDQYLEDPHRSITYGEITGLSAAQKFNVGNGPGSVASLPRYLIEVIPDTTFTSLMFPTAHWAFRITAIGYGASVDTRVVLQEVVRN